MEAAERARVLEANLSRLLHLIGAADGRAGLILALDTAMLGALAALAPNATNWTVCPAVFAVIAALGLLASLGLLSAASFPRVKGPKGSALYFDGIAARSIDQYSQHVAQMTEPAYIEDLGKQCHRNAEIAQAKFYWLQASMIALYLSVLPWAVAVFLLYQGKTP